MSAVIEHPVLEQLESVRVLRLEPDDVLVVRVSDFVSAEQARRIEEVVQSAVGKERRVLVMDKTIDVAVLRQESAAC